MLTILLLALLAAAGGWWYVKSQGGQGDGPGASGRPGGPSAQPVSVGLVDRRDMRVLVSSIGTMNARATTVVRTRVSGELEKIFFKEGDEVRAGQLLAQIDARSYRAALQQAQGTLQRDQALLKNAQLDLRRYQELQAQDSIASQQVDTQAALVRQYQGTVAADQAQVDA
ncbi:MAG TPA: biotin/lipoyl-binding protein, partial [Alicycliphilus sp.]|nr:biotin/lipoyl-binding protein [Alicycliphilus sp.]